MRRHPGAEASPAKARAAAAAMTGGTASPSGPPLRLDRVEAFALRWPLQTPVVTSFGTMHDRPAVLVRVTDADGASGWGEAWCNFPAPAAEYRARLIRQVLAPLCTGAASTFASPVQAWQSLTASTRVLALQCGEPGPFAQCIAAIEMALWDLVARRAGVPLWQLLGGRGQVPVYASGIHPRDAVQRVQQAAAAGHTRFKVKVGFALRDDLSTMAGLCRDHAATAWMVDANQAWDEAAAMAALAELGRLPIQWVEEPIAADAPASAWARLAAVGPRLAAGENLRGQAAFKAATAWLGVLQPDLGKWGGVGAALEVAALARQRGRWFCPHWLGSGVGLAFSLALLDAHLCQDSSAAGWAEVDVNPNPLRDELLPWCQGLHNGLATLGVEPGIGPVPKWPPHLEQAAA